MPNEDYRGQAEVLGFVLLVGLTIIGMTAIVVMGSSVLTDSQANSQVDRAEHALTQLDSKLSLVALGGSTAQQALVSRESTGTRLYVDGTAGWINISIHNSTDGSLDVEVMNVTMGSVVYENEQKDAVVAYQGGGVWRSDPSGSSMISPPELHYRTGQGEDPTLTLPLVIVKGNATLGHTVSMNKLGETTAKYPVIGDDSRSNPLQEGDVNVTIHSEYYEAWGSFFESRTGGTVTYDHDNQEVMITLEIPGSQQTLNHGLTSTSGSDTSSLEGAGGDPTHLDSYNSSMGDYSSTQTSNGTFEAAGTIDVNSNIEIQGSVRSGDMVEVGASAVINGTAYWTTSFNTHGNPTITEGDEQISGVEVPDPVGTKVRNEVDSAESSNNNSGTDLADESLDAGDTVTAGTYYVSDAEVEDSANVTFDTGSNDEITLAVDDSLDLEGATFDIQGNGTVRIYVNDDISIDSSDIVVPDDKSLQLWIYGTEDADIDILSDSAVTGVIYAPTGSSGTGTVTMDKSEVFGAVVGGATTFKHSAVHQDLALTEEKPFPNDPSIPRITYLHVSVNEVSVSNP